MMRWRRMAHPSLSRLGTPLIDELMADRARSNLRKLSSDGTRGEAQTAGATTVVVENNKERKKGAKTL
eukprot:3987753-Pleurochrysis_carterae.AAC.1